MEVYISSEGDTQNGASKVAWGTANKTVPLICLEVVFLDVSYSLYFPSGLLHENKCMSVPWILIT